MKNMGVEPGVFTTMYLNRLEVDHGKKWLGTRDDKEDNKRRERLT